MLTPPEEGQFDILYEQVTQQSHRPPMNYMKNYTIKNVVRFSHVPEGRYGNRRRVHQVFHDWQDVCPWRTSFSVQAQIRGDPPISNAQVIVGPTLDNPQFLIPLDFILRFWNLLAPSPTHSPKAGGLRFWSTDRAFAGRAKADGPSYMRPESFITPLRTSNGTRRRSDL
jgi:hypothetical protein